MEKIFFDEQFQFAIKFKWEEGDTYWLNFECVQSVACLNNDKLEFNNYDLGRGADDCTDFDVAFKEDALCNGFIKWDGCMEIHNLTYHFCGYSNIIQRLVKLIYTGAKEILGNNLDYDLAQLENLNKY